MYWCMVIPVSAGVCRGQRRVIDLLVLELYQIVSNPLCVLRTKLRSSDTADTITLSPTTDVFIIQKELILG